MKRTKFICSIQILVLALLGISCITKSKAQGPILPYQPSWFHAMQQLSPNIREVTKEARNYFHTNDSLIASGDSSINIVENKSLYKKFSRWSSFWEARTDVNGQNTGAITFMKQLASGTQTICPNASLPTGGWKQLGPFNTPEPECSNMSFQVPTGIGWVSKTVVSPHDPNGNVLFACTPNSGLWKSTNGGQNWICLTEKINVPVLGVLDVVIDPVDPNKLFIATSRMYYNEYNFGVGVMLTTNGGETWETSGLVFDPQTQIDASNISSLALSRHSNGTDYTLFAVSPYRVWSSTNKGVTWSDITANIPVNSGEPVNFKKISVDPDNSSILYLDSYTKQVWLSTNRGSSFTSIQENVSSTSSNLFTIQGNMRFEGGIGSPPGGWSTFRWRVEQIGNSKVAAYRPNSAIDNTDNLRALKLGTSNVLFSGLKYKIKYDYSVPYYTNLRVVLKFGSPTINNPNDVTLHTNLENTSGTESIEVTIPSQNNSKLYGIYFIADDLSGYDPINGPPVFIDNVEVTGYDYVNMNIYIVDKPNTASNPVYLLYNAGDKIFVDKLSTNGPFQQIAFFANVNNNINASKTGFAVNTNEDVFYLSGVRGIKYVKSTASETPLGSSAWDNTFVHDDMRHILLYSSSSDGNSDVLYIANDGGLSKTTDGGQTFTYLNNGLAITQLHGIAVDEDEPDYIVCGAQDNGVVIYDKNRSNNKWINKCEVFADGGDAVILRDNNQQKIILAYGNSDVFKSANNSSFVQTSTSNISGIGLWKMLKHPTATTTAYSTIFDVHRLSKTVNGGGAWTYLTPTINYKYRIDNQGVTTTTTPSTIYGLAVAPSNPDVIYISTQNGNSGSQSITQSDNLQAFMRTIDGGQNWTDLSHISTLQPLIRYGMTIRSIAVDPLDENRIWVAANGYGYEYRVFYSNDGGNAWSNVSQGLPLVNIQKIIYQNGSDDIIYAATDVGVYYWNKSLNSWECFTKNLPVTLVTDIEINYCANKIRIGTYGKGLWEADLLPGKTIEITTSTTWNTVQKPLGDVLVKSGVTLTITSTVNMPANSRIRVERGAVLNVNGGTLTNSCGYMWHGVEVYGNPQLAQLPESNQGVALLTNATLQHARSAFATVKTNADGTLDWPFCGGGIIKAQNTQFLNNRKSIGITAYHAPQRAGMAEANYRGYIDQCTFKATQVLNDPTYIDASNGRRLSSIEFMTLWEVKGVLVRGNTFINEITNQPLVLEGDRIKGTGILAIDASMIVEAKTITPMGGGTPTVTPNHFKNLSVGIDYQSTGTLTTAYIRNNLFENTERSITLNAGAYTRIYGNRFELNSSIDNSIAKPIGIFGMKHSAFTITENDFDNVPGGWGRKVYGVDINGTNTLGGEVYKNHFIKQMFAQQTEQDNEALRIKCNHFDRSVAHDLEINPSSGSKKYPYFGSCQSIPGESPTDPTNSFGYIPYPPLHIYKQSYPTVLKYLVSSSNSFKPISPQYVMPVSEVNINPCGNPALIGVFSCLTKVSQSGSIFDGYNFREGNTLAAQKMALIDGGSTSSLLALFTAQPALSGSALETALIAPGSYLSDVVLLAAINQGSQLSEAQLVNILLTNASLSPEVWEAVENRQPAIGEEAMLNLQTAQTGNSPRQILEEEIRSLRVLSRNALNAEVGNYLYLAMTADSVAPFQDSAIALLEESGERADLMLLIPTYISRGELGKAQASLITLGTADAELQDFAVLMNLLIELKSNSQVPQQANSTSLASIETVAEANHTTAYLARSLRKLVVDADYTYQPEEAEEEGGEGMQPQTSTSQKIISLQGNKMGIVSVYPNPAQDVITVTYKLATGTKQAQVELVDMAGHRVLLQSLSVEPRQSSVNLNTALLAAGVYYCKATTDGKIMSVAKVVITR